MKKEKLDSDCEERRTLLVPYYSIESLPKLYTIPDIGSTNISSIIGRIFEGNYNESLL